MAKMDKRRRKKKQRSAAARKGWITRRKNKKKRHQQKKMFRVTVGANYFIRQKRKREGKKKRSESPASAAVMVRAWFRTAKQAEAAISKLADRAIAYRETVVEAISGAFIHGNDEEEVDTQIHSVPYDSNLIGTVSEVNEA